MPYRHEEHMFTELLIGGLIITLSIAVQAVIIGVIETLFSRFRPWLIKPPRIAKMVLTLIIVVLIIMIGVTISTWVWAATFLALGALETLKEAVYFATVCFTTLGFGDITLSPKWRILSSLTAANGLIIFGLSTAFLMEFIFELRKAQREFLNKRQLAKQRKKEIKKQVKKLLSKQTKRKLPK